MFFGPRGGGESSVSVFKGNGLESLVVAGFEVVCKEGLSILEIMSPLCRDVDFLWAEPIFCKPLSYFRPVVNEIPDCSGSTTSDLVLQFLP